MHWFLFCIYKCSCAILDSNILAEASGVSANSCQKHHTVLGEHCSVAAKKKWFLQSWDLCFFTWYVLETCFWDVLETCFWDVLEMCTWDTCFFTWDVLETCFFICTWDVLEMYLRQVFLSVSVLEMYLSCVFLCTWDVLESCVLRCTWDVLEKNLKLVF